MITKRTTITRAEPRSDLGKQVGFNAQRAPIIHILGFSVFLTLLTRTAWQTDETYMVWRLVDNFVHGFGLRNNIDERVQAFTSTLWTILNGAVYALSRNIYCTLIPLSLICSLLAIWVAAPSYRKSTTLPRRDTVL
jgi:hypothetical protein